MYRVAKDEWMDECVPRREEEQIKMYCDCDKGKVCMRKREEVQEERKSNE